MRICGSGTAGVVYQVRDPQRGCVLALKLLRPAGKKLAQRLRREFLTMQRLHHPQLVAVFDWGTYCDRPYFTMEWVDGQRFSDLFHPADGHSPDAAALRTRVELARQVLNPLAHLHNEGVVHRDLKAENIMVDCLGVVKLLDFGLVKDPEISLGFTLPGALLGTPATMSPEQIEGKQVDARADLYSFGVVLYESCTGRPPIEASSLGNLLLRRVSEPPTPPRSLNPAIDAELEDVLQRLLARDPTSRFSSAFEVADRLDRWLATGEPPAAGRNGAKMTSPPRDLPSSSVAPAGAFFPSLVGRAAELEQVDGILSQVARGKVSACWVMIDGETGSGKTRLATEIGVRAQQVGFRFARGGCGGTRRSLLPFDSIFRSLLVGPGKVLGTTDLEPAVRTALQALAAYLPSLTETAHELDPVPVPALSPVSERHRVIDALAVVIAALARDRGLLLIVEDLQEADELCLSALWHILSRFAKGTPEAESTGTARHRIVVVTTFTPNAATEGPADVGAGDGHSSLCTTTIPGSRYRLVRIELGRLGTMEVQAMVSSMLGGVDVPKFAEWIYGHTGGHPLFVLETVHLLLSEGTLRRRHDGRWVLTVAERPEGDATADELCLPDFPESLYDVIRRRLEQLDPDTKAVLRAAAVIGPVASLELLARATGRDEHDLLWHASALCRAAMLTPLGDYADSFRFDHDMVREVVLGSCPPDERARWHLCAAAALEQAGTEGTAVASEDIAYHYVLADDKVAALPWLLWAATEALASGRNRSCWDLLERSRLLSADTGLSADTELYAELHELSGRVALRMGRFEQAREFLSSALQGATRAGNVALEATLRGSLAECALQAGELTDARHEAEQAVAAARRHGIPQTEGDALYVLARAAAADHQRAEELRLIRAASDAYRTAKDLAGESRALLHLGRAQLDSGQAAWAAGLFRQALALAQQAEDPDTMAWASYRLGEAFRWAGRVVQATAYFRASLTEAQRFGILLLEQLSEVSLIGLEIEAGVASESEESLLRIKSAMLGGQFPVAVGLLCLELARVTCNRGAFQRGRAHVFEALQAFRKARDREGEAMAIAEIGHSRWLQGDADGAAEAFEKSLALAHRMRLVPPTGRIRAFKALLALDAGVAPAELTPDIVAAFSAMKQGGIGRYTAQLQAVVGYLGVLSGDADEGLRTLARAIDDGRDRQELSSELLGAGLHALALASRQDRAEAERVVSRTVDRAIAAGWMAWAQRLPDLLGRL